MDPILNKLIFDKVDKLNDWTQSVTFSYDGYTTIDLSSAIGKNCVTPSDAKNQPSRYQRGTVYQFDPAFYRGIEKANDLKANLMDACVGCGLCQIRGHSDSKGRSSQRHAQFDLHCSCYLVQGKNDEDAFNDKCMSKRGIKKETVKVQKTKGQRRGVDKMDHTTKISKSARMAKQKIYSENQPEARRTKSRRAPCAEKRCSMALSIFMDKFGYWYLSSNGCLDHVFHAYLAPEITEVKVSELDEKEEFLIGSMYNAGIGSKQICKVMEKYVGKEFATKTMDNLCAKMKKAKKLLQGITSEMSSAEKAIKFMEK